MTVAGAGGSLALMDGLAHTLPGGVLSAEGISLSTATADQLRIADFGSQAAPTEVILALRGRADRLKVSAVLGHEVAGALSLAQVAVMPLAHLQTLAGLPHRVSRILIESQPGHRATVEHELRRLVDDTISVAPANQEVSLLSQALKPSNQASTLFAGLAALLGFLFAFNAILLTIPERRAAIADLRLDGTRRTAIIQMVIFQALCLGVVSSLARPTWRLCAGTRHLSEHPWLSGTGIHSRRKHRDRHPPDHLLADRRNPRDMPRLGRTAAGLAPWKTVWTRSTPKPVIATGLRDAAPKDSSSRSLWGSWYSRASCSRSCPRRRSAPVYFSR